MVNEKVSLLTLVVINDGAGYQERLGLARRMLLRNRSDQNIAAAGWLRIASDAARKWERQFSEGKLEYTTRDVLQVADELAEYYAQHLSEF
ncbi:MAG TPA: hypothetical protein VHT52_12225 [Stellaceae bacterium]|jgi:hypothetical protein|nr:hypothetical protein [Stellaceae bacterium]